MESQISPNDIAQRVDAMAAATAPKPAEAPLEAAKPADAAATPPADKPAEPSAAVAEAKPAQTPAPTPAPAEKPAEKKQPNDTAELRKWATKAAQEASEARKEVQALKAAIEKLAKKPVDYAALAKDPDGLKAHIEQERQEAIADLQKQLSAEKNEVVKNETIVERMRRENDKENYPRWEKQFPLIQTLVNNRDGRINWNQGPAGVLDSAYELAEQLSPGDAPAVVAPAVVPVAATPVAAFTQEQLDARVAEAVKKATADAEQAIRNEVNGGGVGSVGKGGKRDANVSADAFRQMDLKDLKAHLQKQK